MTRSIVITLTKTFLYLGCFLLRMSDKTDELRDIFMDTTGTDTITESQEESGSKIRGEENDARPTTNISCPECGNDRAYYEMKQIRSADESETRFFECTECNYKWREDDH